jgi:hypothetical protein
VTGKTGRQSRSSGPTGLRMTAPRAEALAFTEESRRRATANRRRARENFRNIRPWRVHRWLSEAIAIYREQLVLARRTRESLAWDSEHK